VSGVLRNGRSAVTPGALWGLMLGLGSLLVAELPGIRRYIKMAMM
jgi:hypothetical protein